MAKVHTVAKNKPTAAQRRRAGFYLMENPREAQRLERKTDQSLAEQQFRWAGLTSRMSALEVGCGSGATTRVMARLAAPGSVVGIDQSAVRLAEGRRLAARAKLMVEFREGDAYCLPFTAGHFDFAWSRFLFQYLPQPQLALKELIRVTRPGGIVTVADLDGQIEQFYPLTPKLRAELDDALRLLAQTGFDTRIGRKLYSMFFEAGLRELQVRVTPYQVYSGKLRTPDMANWRLKIETAAAHLIESTGDRLRWTRFRDRLITRLGAPDLFYYCTMIQVRGTVPKKSRSDVY
jgi:ubiquinone/menaquinone biosynthesis C-methylase UbiE